MKKRISRSVMLTATAALLVTAALIISILFDLFAAQSAGELRREAETLQYSLRGAKDEVAFLKGLPTDYRITLVARDGSVLFDNSADPSAMTNHAERPEIAEAFVNGQGEARRRSATLAEETCYYALLTTEGNVLRVAITRATMMGMCIQVLPMLSGLLVLVLLGIFLLSERLTAWIVRPVNQLNLDEPLENEAYDELSPLLTRMDHQRRELRSRMQQLVEARQQIEAVTDNMQEGLILLDQHGDVLSMNSSAAGIFDVDGAACADKPFLELVRDAELYEAITAARQGENAMAMLLRDERHYRAFASPVIRQEQPDGVVVLLLDVTESYAAEVSRREFTANVSHELKTPLTAIAGYAEIIRDGVARDEDIPGFAGRICKETNRLITLLDDIFELARLDERKGLGEQASLDLADCARDASSRLESAAEQKRIVLSMHCESAPVTGYCALLTEMCFNLTDNAIRYTQEGGRVSIATGVADMHPFIEVQDNGIGIPEEHQTRVFERFYRVDKSRSKASGGTGLGLAIVKHVAHIHHAEISLDSQVGKGTRIRILFPAQ